MGSGQSVTYTVSVHEPRDESQVVIKVSDSVVRKVKGELNGTHEATPEQSVTEHHEPETPSLPGVPTPRDELIRQQRELEKLELSWRSRLQALQDQNVLLKAAAESLAEPLVEPKIPPRPEPSSQARAVMKCYSENLNRPLKCSSELKQFLHSSLQA
ncbi:hypothetical protein HDE_08569 [Halotydeus destructor]|nr:hypothetical protein HDE_08569 [Halotydeus destructor]